MLIWGGEGVGWVDICSTASGTRAHILPHIKQLVVLYLSCCLLVGNLTSLSRGYKTGTYPLEWFVSGGWGGWVGGGWCRDATLYIR